MLSPSDLDEAKRAIAKAIQQGRIKIARPLGVTVHTQKAEHLRQLRANRIASGKCTDCGKQKEAGVKVQRCATCREKQRAIDSKRTRAKK